MSAYQYLEVIDLSATGAQLRGPVIPMVGKTALFRLEEFQVLCKVVWANDESCGVRFDEPITPAVLAHFSKAGSPPKIGMLATDEQPADEG